MDVLSSVANGFDRVPSISERIGKSVPQVYKDIASLSGKGAASLDRGRVGLCRGAFMARLADVLRNSDYARVALSGAGLDILAELRSPGTASSVSERLSMHRTCASKKISELAAIGMVAKSGRAYSINDAMWPFLRGMADSYADSESAEDPRAPPGSRIIYRCREYVLFEDMRDHDYPLTAFSRYGEFGISFYPGTRYYMSGGGGSSLEDVFAHSLRAISAGGSWRLRMMALILYAKHRGALSSVDHPVRAEMDAVLRGERVKGWVKLSEMQERADMYGVVLRRLENTVRFCRHLRNSKQKMPRGCARTCSVAGLS
jgi:hypothetical protein